MVLVLCKIFAFSTFWVCLIWTILIRYGEMGNLAPQSKLVKFLRRGIGGKLMASEWTKEERKQAGVDLKKMYRKRGVDMLDVAYEAVMQRNRALAAEKMRDADDENLADDCTLLPKSIRAIVDAAIAACKKGGAK
jgi:hypothetical protein